MRRLLIIGVAALTLSATAVVAWAGTGPVANVDSQVTHTYLGDDIDPIVAKVMALIENARHWENHDADLVHDGADMVRDRQADHAGAVDQVVDRAHDVADPVRDAVRDGAMSDVHDAVDQVVDRAHDVADPVRDAVRDGSMSDVHGAVDQVVDRAHDVADPVRDAVRDQSMDRDHVADQSMEMTQDRSMSQAHANDGDRNHRDG